MNVDLVLANKGGVGKSLIASFIFLARQDLNIPTTLIEVEVNQRLERYDSHWISAQRSEKDMLKSGGEAFTQHFDNLGQLIKSMGQDIVVDMGAQMATEFIDWASRLRKKTFSNDIHFRFFVPSTADDESLTDALTILYQVGEVFPSADRFFIANSVTTNFVVSKDTDRAEDALADKKIISNLNKAKGGGSEIKTLILPRNPAPGGAYFMFWPYGMHKAIVDEDAVTRVLVDSDDAPFTEFAFPRAYDAFSEWYQETLDKFIHALQYTKARDTQDQGHQPTHT
jgi:hypothetical protein